MAAPAAVPAEIPDFSQSYRTASLRQVFLISLLTALLAGALGGALGYVAAVRGGVSGQTTLGSGSTDTTGSALRAPDSLAAIARSVLPSVVTIRVDGDFGSAIGSGFIVSSDGYVITNDHVVSGLTGNATIKFNDSSTTSARLVGNDPESDIAVLKIDKTGLPAVTFGDSDALAVGDPVLAIGAPLDLPNSVTYGIISAMHRPLEINESGGPTRYYAAIQTDAAVNHGNSGGPLIDAAGHVIGVDSVIKSLGSTDQEAGSIGLAFAIPIDQAKRVAQQLIDTGKVTRTVIGVTVQQSFHDRDGGVLLASAVTGGPAAEAGMRAGDVIVKVGSGALDEAGDLIALVREYAPGTVIPVTYKRQGVSHVVRVKLAVDTS